MVMLPERATLKTAVRQPLPHSRTALVSSCPFQLSFKKVLKCINVIHIRFKTKKTSFVT